MFIQKTYKFTFGKYKGKLVSEVLKENPSYIKWVHENVDWITVPDRILKEIPTQVEKDTNAYQSFQRERSNNIRSNYEGQEFLNAIRNNEMTADPMGYNDGW